MSEAAPRLEHVRGRITVVQEDRFHLVTPDGRTFLFTLAEDARLRSGDAEELHAAGATVEVAFDGRPGLSSCRAREVRALTLPHAGE
jgi:hypothetical protein